TRTERPFESRVNNVSPSPRRAALTLVGFESSDAGVGVVPFDFVEVVVPLGFVVPVEVFVTPFEVFVAPASGFGLLWFGLAVAFALSVFSFGREVKNAPRTSSCS